MTRNVDTWVVLVLLLGVASGAGATEVVMTVTDSRPVWAGLSKISNEYHGAFTYEDPLIEFAGDLEDFHKTHGVKADEPFWEPRIVTLTWKHPVDAAGKADEAVVLQSLVQAAEQAGYYFKTVSRGGMVHVVPVAILNQKGERVEYPSLFERRVTLPPNNRSIVQFLADVCQAASVGTNVIIEVDSFWAMGLRRDRRRIADAPVNQPARDVISKVFKDNSLGSWALICHPDTRLCLLQGL